MGVLPGIGPVGAMAILLPSTFAVPLVTGIIILAGIYYGAMYGGSTTSILVNIPGEAASFVTCLDGYQMARQGAQTRPWVSRPWAPLSAARHAGISPIHWRNLR